MIHYFGGPITPDTCALRAWRGRHAFISFAHQQQMNLAASITQSFALDNGAFSLWKAGRATNWESYYKWVAGWSTHPGFDFAVIPDVIDGTEAENDELLKEWPMPRHIGAPVWHTNESLDRLDRLSREWPRVCLGSSGEHDVSKVTIAVPHLRKSIRRIVDATGRPRCKLHGLRMLNPAIFTEIPLASADSTNLARSIGIDKAWTGSYRPVSKETRATIIAERTESFNSADCLPDPFLSAVARLRK